MGCGALSLGIRVRFRVEGSGFITEGFGFGVLDRSRFWSSAP